MKKKKLFDNISGVIQSNSNNISQILMLFEYFRNMYPCHRRLRKLQNLRVDNPRILRIKNEKLSGCYFHMN